MEAKATQTARCEGCGRNPRECWLAPCLVLECILAEGTDAVNDWLKYAGAPFRVEDKECEDDE